MMEDLITRLGNLLGHFHPALIHFPIALLLTGAAFEARQGLRRSAERSEIARLLLLLGALGAVAAAASGLLLFHPGDYRDRTLEVIRLHRLLGLATMTLALAAAVTGGLRAARGPMGRRLHVYRVLYSGAAALAGLTGHYGGWVVFGWGHVWTP